MKIKTLIVKPYKLEPKLHVKKQSLKHIKNQNWVKFKIHIL